MPTFDQRGQRVKYQFNADNIHFGSIQDRISLATELQKLEDEVRKAARVGALDEEVAVDVESKIKKATIQAQKSEPDKKTTLEHLNEAKALIEGVTSAAGLVAGLTQAVEVVKRLF